MTDAEKESEAIREDIFGELDKYVL